MDSLYSDECTHTHIHVYAKLVVIEVSMWLLARGQLLVSGSVCHLVSRLYIPQLAGMYNVNETYITWYVRYNKHMANQHICIFKYNCI